MARFKASERFRACSLFVCFEGATNDVEASRALDVFATLSFNCCLLAALSGGSERRGRASRARHKVKDRLEKAKGAALERISWWAAAGPRAQVPVMLESRVSSASDCLR